MSKRKVATSHTLSYRGLFGGHSTTRVYAHDDGPSRTSRALAFTGVSPWDKRRASVTGVVLLVLWAFGTSEWLGLAVVVLLAALFFGLRWRRNALARVSRVPAAVAPGSDWCDRCAEWTVHETAQHVA